jgi:hypothetical protein
MPFDLNSGSFESHEFLIILSEKTAALCQFFNAEIIQKILEFKMTKVWPTGFVVFMLYLAYLMCVTFVPYKWLMTIWLVIQSILKILVLKGLYYDSWVNFSNELMTFWNLLDFIRLAVLLAFIVCAENEDIHLDYRTNTASLLITISWIALLDNLRIFTRFQFILTLIRKSIIDIGSFSIILCLVN